MTDTTEKRVFAPSDSAEFMRRRAAERKAKRRKEAKKRANKRAKKRRQTGSAATRHSYEQLARATGGARRQARLIG